MKSFKFFLLIFAVALPWLAEAGFAPKSPIIHAETAPKNGAQVKVDVLLPETEKDLEESKKLARAILSQSPKGELVVIADENDAEMQAIAAEIASGTIDARSFHKVTPVKDWIHRHYRKTFTAVSWVLAGTLVSTSLILSNQIEPSSALAMGFLSGGIMAGFQYWNQDFQGWLRASKSMAVQFVKWFSIEAFCLAVEKLASVPLGIGHEPTLFHSVAAVVGTAFFAMLAQGPWDVSFAKKAGMDMKLYPDFKDHIKFSADSKALVLNSIVVASSVAKLFELPFSNVSLAAIGTSGAVALLLAHRKAKVCDKYLVD